MMAWCRQLSLALRHVRASAKQNKTPFSNSYSTCMKHFSSPRQLPSFQRDFDINSKSVIGAFYKWLQQKGISTSTKMMAESETGLTPVSSPLIPVLSPSSGASASVKTKPSTVQAVLKGIRQSPKKVNLVAQLVRGMRVEDALLQLQVTVKRAAKTLYKVIKSARANASHNHGLDPERLVVAEAFVGKGLYLKRLSYHAKGRCGIMVRPHCRLTVVVREITAAEEAKIAMIKVMNYKKLTRKERQLVPHQLIETTPRWSRRPTETAHVEA